MAFITKRFHTEEPDFLDNWLNGLEKPGMRANIVGYVVVDRTLIVTVKVYKIEPGLFGMRPVANVPERTTIDEIPKELAIDYDALGEETDHD